MENSWTFSCYILFKATCPKSGCAPTLHIPWNILLNQILNLFIYGPLDDKIISVCAENPRHGWGGLEENEKTKLIEQESFLNPATIVSMNTLVIDSCK